MSFLLVTGKLYHCESCGAQVRVEYEGGAQLTQIGDENVFEQMELAERLGQPGDNPEREGYWLHDFMICGDCRVSLGGGNDAGLTLLDMLEAAFQKRDELFAGVAAGLAQGMEALSDEDWRQLLGKEVFEELAGRSLLPAKKQKKLNGFFQSHLCLEKFLAARQANKRPNLKTELMATGHAAQEFAAAHGLTGRFEVLRPVQTWQPENLNPYIQAATTVRWPVADTPQVTVYRRAEVNLPRVLAALADVSMPEVSDTKPLIASVKAQAQRRFIGPA